MRKQRKNSKKNLFHGFLLRSRPDDVPRMSRSGCHFGTFLGRSRDVSPKLKDHAITNF